ncbi:MAG: Jag N-terminal domain-containing protein [Firmicutes bacterium]|nr:Jag N-terminal domain-containing protein [Bacillota bacterium]
MLLEFEATGKNIEKAIENALFELKAVRDDVDIKILEQGGLFKKARVLVTISEDAREKYLRREQARNLEEVEETINEVVDAAEELANSVEETFEEIEKEITKEEKKELKEEQKELKKAEKEERKLAKKSEKLNAEQFLEGFVKVSGCGNEVTALRTDDEVRIVINGDKSSDLIGYRGECMNALQYIASVIENENADKKTRVILDIENYRERREETLKALAHRMAKKVLKTGKSAKLEPMCANDRRIIHTELADVEGVSTISKGTEPNRYLIVIPEEKN